MKKLLFLLVFIPIVSFGQKINDADALKLCISLQRNNIWNSLFIHWSMDYKKIYTRTR